MRDSLFQVVKELENHSDPDRVREAALLQDELREAQQMVTRIRESAADAAVARYGVAYASELAETPIHTMRALAEGFTR